MRDIDNIIKEVIGSFLERNLINESYKMTDLDELMEYMWLKPQVSLLNVDVFIDDGGAYKRYKHSILVFVRNGYDKSVSDFFPISVSINPQILDDDIELHISEEDIVSIKTFIRNNVALLTLMAKAKISHDMFVEHLKLVEKYAIAEEKKLVAEMATLRTTESGLPVDLWLDEGGLYQGHAPRIKFKASNEQRTTREYSSMLISNPQQIENLPSNSRLRKRDINKIQMFVINNQKLLMQLANGEIDYRTQFLPNIVK